MSALVLREAPFDGVPWAFLTFSVPRFLCSPSSCLWPWNQSQSATLKDDSAPLPHQQERGMRREEASYDHGCTGVFTLEGQNQSSAMLHKHWSYGSSMIGCAAISVTPLTRQNMMVTLPPGWGGVYAECGLKHSFSTSTWTHKAQLLRVTDVFHMHRGNDNKYEVQSPLVAINQFFFGLGCRSFCSECTKQWLSCLWWLKPAPLT